MPHIHEKIDFTVETYVIHQNRVLLRMHDKYKIWLSVGGHVELDEDPTQAAVREVKEEVGLDVELVGEIIQTGLVDPEHKELLPPRFMNRHRINNTHEHISLIYFATSASDAVVENDEERSGGWRWFTREELADPRYGVRLDIQAYARAALQALVQ